MAGSLAALTLDRSRKGDFSAPVFTGQFLLVEPMPAIENRFFAPIKPFQPMVNHSNFPFPFLKMKFENIFYKIYFKDMQMNTKVWLLVGVFLVVVSVVSSVIFNSLNIKSGSLRLNKKAIADYTLYAIQVITARGNYK